MFLWPNKTHSIWGTKYKPWKILCPSISLALCAHLNIMYYYICAFLLGKTFPIPVVVDPTVHKCVSYESRQTGQTWKRETECQMFSMTPSVRWFSRPILCQDLLLIFMRYLLFLKRNTDEKDRAAEVRAETARFEHGVGVGNFV